MKKFLLAAAFFAFGLSNVQAQYSNNRYGSQERERYDIRRDDYNQQSNRKNREVDLLQRDIRKQIEVGINRRTLTQREASRLKQEYGRISAMEQKFTHKGRLSNREVRILKDQLNRLMADTQRLNRNYRDHRADQYKGRNRY